MWALAVQGEPPLLSATALYPLLSSLTPSPSARVHRLNILFMLVCGAIVNGPYALITTAVSADLGTHKSLQVCTAMPCQLLCNSRKSPLFDLVIALPGRLQAPCFCDWHH